MPPPADLQPPADATDPDSHNTTHHDLQRGIIITRVSPAVAWTMIALFLATFYAVPVYQAATELMAGHTPGAADLFASKKIPAKADLKRYEDALHEQSIARRLVQPRVQQLISAPGGFGNTSVVIGTGQWLYYRPGVDFITGPGFLEPGQLHRRAHNTRDASTSISITADPRPAILAFDRSLRQAGIHLVLLPIPEKAALHPHPLARSKTIITPPANPSFGQFLHEMQRAGIDVFDPTPPDIHPTDAFFLIHDTHWTPQWMDHVAQSLANHIRPHLPPSSRVPMQSLPQQINRSGDLADMLELPLEQKIFVPRTITIHRIVGEDRRALKPSPDSAVLLLGDSFTNIFSAAPMGWGDSAGLGEHLSFHLGRQIDVIARNDAGARATREILANDLANRKNRLAGKKILIWQFAARELATGDWPIIPIPLPFP